MSNDALCISSDSVIRPVAAATALWLFLDRKVPSSLSALGSGNSQRQRRPPNRLGLTLLLTPLWPWRQRKSGSAHQACRSAERSPSPVPILGSIPIVAAEFLLRVASEWMALRQPGAYAVAENCAYLRQSSRIARP